MTTLTTIWTVAVLALPLEATPSADRESLEFFEKQVRPVLVEKCFSCHGPKVQRGGLRMDSRKALLAGGDSGPSLVPGNPKASLFLKAVRHQGDLKMPPKEKDRLDDKAIGALAHWVKSGAPWPANEPTKPALSSVELARKTHWSFRPVQRPPVPTTKDRNWAITPIDHFILATLEAKGMTPSKQADRRTLIRRLSFDLTGLPPTPESVAAFVEDPRPDAYERLVDRLLASPAYGERWGRHWLDVARYADTKGYVFQEERRFPYSYTYRDYVIDAFNSDLSYDRFVVEQLAADRLPSGTDRSHLAAMGYLTLGRRFLNNANDIIDDRIDVVTRGLMGLTVSCARCHDHKYDPIPTRDYYSLHGVFASSIEPRELPLLEKPDPSKGDSPFEIELKKRQQAHDALAAKFHAELTEKLRRQAGAYLFNVGDDLDRRLRQRWQRYLARASAKHRAVLAPVQLFVNASTADYPKVAARIAANDRPAKVNPLVAKAFTREAPKTLAEVAKRYQKLFDEAVARWQETLKNDPKATKLADDNLEAIRQILYGADSPAVVPITEIQRALPRDQRNRLMGLKRRLDQWRATGKGGPKRGMVLVDAPNPVQPHVLVRGNPNNRGIAVPRQFLEVLSPERKPFADGSGRLELARAIASKDNPLTARVLVNRVWLHHFGAGIVRTPGDFGTRGDPPTHPELLDWLADEFVASGWSIKTLHRLMLRSATYRQASDDNASGWFEIGDVPSPRHSWAVDPENRWWGRMNRKRLEFEPLRDAMLAVAGTLNRALGGPGVEITQAPYPTRRTVYAFIERQNLPGVFRSFDLASPDVSTPKRHATTVPQQSLFLMNHPFVQQQAQAVMARPDVREASTDEERIHRLHQLAYGRLADPDELALGLAFVRQPIQNRGRSVPSPPLGTDQLSPWEQYAQVLLLANEFAFVD